MRRLRVAHVIVQPVLVWDDGDNLEPGPPVQPQSIPASHLADFAETLDAQVAGLQAELLVEPADTP